MAIDEEVCEAQLRLAARRRGAAMAACVGPRDAVEVSGGLGATWLGCEPHGAALLEELPLGRVAVGTVPGAAIRVYKAAQARRALQQAAEQRPGWTTP